MLKYGRIIPPQQVSYVGSTVIMNCVSEIQPMWAKDGNDVQRGTIVETALVINNVMEEDTGTYVCYGSTSELTPGHEFRATSHLLVGGNFN